MKLKLIPFLLFISVTSVFAQDDNIIGESLDSLVDVAPLMAESDKDQLRDPKRAALYSAVLPGMGQAYNRKYWKIPLIYGGFFALGYYIDWNNDNYNFYRGALFDAIDGDPDTINDTGFNSDQLRQIADEFRRNRDILIILTGVLYGLNIVDAHVDAHLKEFDINEDLAMSIRPSTVNTRVASGAGISLAIRIK